MAIFKVLSTDTVEDAFINKYNPTTDEIIVSISRAANVLTFLKEGGGNIQGILLPEQDGKISGLLLTTGVNNLTFDVSAGTYNIADEVYSYAGGTFLLTDGDAVLDRIDLAVVNTAGALVIKVGTPSATPVAPIIAVTETAVASFIVKAGAKFDTSGDVFVNVVEQLATDGAYIPSDNIAKPLENPGGGAENLPDLNDVTLAGLTAFQVLQYNGANWENAFVDILQITGIDLSGLVDNQILKYNSGTGDFEPADNTLEELEDTDTTSAVDDNILVYDGGIWEARDNVDNLTLGASIKFSGAVSPAQITANVDNYNPTGLNVASILRLDLDANREISGIAAQVNNTVLHIINISTSDLKFKNNSGSSLAANRFALNGDITLKDNQALILWYDGISNLWRALATYKN